MRALLFALREEAAQHQREACALAPWRRERRKEADAGGWIFCGSESLRQGSPVRCSRLDPAVLHDAHGTRLLMWCIGSEGSGICSFSENFRGFIPRNDTVACAEA